jgi:hypothetical protein
MRLSKYTKSPIDYFLEQPIGDFYAWVKTMNDEINLERKMQKQAEAEARARYHSRRR